MFVSEETTFSLDGRLTAKPSLVRRAIPEWRTMMVFEPDGPKLCSLNPVSWLLLELCNGRTLSEIEDHFVQLLGNRLTRAEAKSKLHAGLRLLFRFDLLLRCPIAMCAIENADDVAIGI